MNGKKNGIVTVGFVLAVSLVAASLTAGLCGWHYSRVQFRMLGELCGEIVCQQPEAEGAVAAALKICQEGNLTDRSGGHANLFESSQGEERQMEASSGEALLLSYGYQPGDFLRADSRSELMFALAGFLAAAALYLLTWKLWHRKEASRIQSLTEYLENVNTGGSGLLFSAEEDAFSGLQDEIYKTVTALYQTKNAALQAKDNFAENLSNIAHQLKTPITSISLSLQMLRDHPSPERLELIRQQLSRLTRLEEALLLLSRIEAGTLTLEAERVDVFTLLTLAGDNLQELFHEAGVSFTVPEDREVIMMADLEWTMEAVMNLLKNCLEHTPPGGTVSCAYEQNPLYTQIRIWDSGSGFSKEDLPRLFERFYRGAGSSGIGIGLSLAKEILERQNGTISARNLPRGGACFEIRMYSH